MGMSASQARLLSITARLTDNENSGQSISYSKIRLADKMDQVNSHCLNKRQEEWGKDNQRACRIDEGACN